MENRDTIDEAMLYLKSSSGPIIINDINCNFTWNPSFKMKPSLAARLFFYSLLESDSDSDLNEELLDEYPRLTTSWNIVQEVIPAIKESEDGQLRYGFYKEGNTLHQKMCFVEIPISILQYCCYTVMNVQKLICDCLGLNYGAFILTINNCEYDVDLQPIKFSISSIDTTKVKHFFEPPELDVFKNKVRTYYEVMKSNRLNHVISNWSDYSSVVGLNALLGSIPSNGFREYKGTELVEKLKGKENE